MADYEENGHCRFCKREDCGGCISIIGMLPNENEGDDEIGDQDENNEEDQLEVEEQE